LRSQSFLNVSSAAWSLLRFDRKRGLLSPPLKSGVTQQMKSFEICWINTDEHCRESGSAPGSLMRKARAIDPMSELTYFSQRIGSNLPRAQSFGLAI